MIQRDRAWRRRKERIVERRDDEQNQVLFRPTMGEVKPEHKVEKPHRPGALTHAQDLRQRSALGDELREADHAE